MVRLVATLSLVFVCACEPVHCPELPSPAPVTNEPFGGACRTDDDCAEGLECFAYVSTESALRICSYPCDQRCLEAGGTCLTLRADTGGEGEVQRCMPPCESDSDCNLGSMVGVCGSGNCLWIQCSSQYENVCPAGSRCVGEICTEIEGGGGYGIDGGWCQRG